MADTAGWFGGVDSDSGLVGVWPSEARELPGLGLSSVRDRSGDDVRAHTTGRAGSMTFASCFLISGSSLQHRCQQSAQCTLYNKHLSFSFCSVKHNKTNRLNQVPVSGFYMFSIFRLHCMHCADAAYCYTSHIAGDCNSIVCASFCNKQTNIHYYNELNAVYYVGHADVITAVTSAT